MSYKYLLIVFILLLWGCRGFEQVIEIDLEETPSELVVECYLEPNQPFRLLLTETKPYLEVVNACPFVRHALVVITHKGQRDTLHEAAYGGRGCSTIRPFFDRDSIRFYNYGSTTLCSYDTNEDYLLEVWDTVNQRYASARTRFLPIVPIQSLSYSEFNSSDWFRQPPPQTSVFLGCEDNLQERNYYRLTLHKNSLSRTDTTGALFNKVAVNPHFDVVLFDQGVYNDGYIAQQSPYDYYLNDIAIGTIYHIDNAYYQYLLTSRAARNANLNPFLQPAKVQTNIQGGQGIFTALSYDRQQIIIR